MNPSTSANMIIDTILYHQIKTDYSEVEYDIDNVYDYKNKNVYIFISKENLFHVKDFYINDEDAPLIDQNLDAFYNINYGKIEDIGIYNSKGEYFSDYISISERGRVITIPNWAIGFVISEDLIIEVENGLLKCIERGYLNPDCCRVIMSFGFDYSRIM
jgi:hypothetical protein